MRTAVRERALALVKDEGKEGYEHPWDCAIAAYIWLLARSDAEQAVVVAANIATARGCWWAKKFSDELLSSEERSGAARSATKEEGLATG